MQTITETNPRINFDEKLQLAKSLNLKEQISLLECRKVMLDLKFKEIRREEILKRLSFYRWRFSFRRMIKLIPLFFGLVLLPMLLFYSILGSYINSVIVFFYSCCSVFFSIWLIGFQKTKIDLTWINGFKHEIPYGAMLALKEASEKGLIEHRIWYPVWSDKEFGFDPIITGRIGEKLYEIYTWNENDVYEEK